SFEDVKEKFGSSDVSESHNAIFCCDEKDKMIPFLISKLDFKDQTSWVQGETRVNLVRRLRSLTKRYDGHDDKFIYFSNDDEIKKVKLDWDDWWNKISKTASLN
ncbi:MAG: hypothetical protein MUC52_02180, partial [Candidatus Omnitrophica bacterium]|nr:hypothetical protein [Candidatus Omnitrophota bacterium]